MGDMADFSLDYAADNCELYDKFMGGQLSVQEAYDQGLIDELGYEGRGAKGWNSLVAASKPSKVTCKFCGKSLRWKQHTSGKWWMMEKDGTWHKCNNE